MFQSKIQERKKIKKQHGIFFWVAGAFTFAIEFMLGVNASFLADQSLLIVTHNMLADTPLDPLASVIALLVSLIVGFCLVGGGMWVFAGFINTLEDARSYQEAYGTSGWPVALLWLLLVFVMSLDFFTLLFRAAYFAEKGATALFAFFIVLIFIPPVIGPLIHVLENTPRDRRLTRSRNRAEVLEIDDIESAVDYMDPDLRSRWLAGDQTALSEHYERIDDERQRQYDAQQQKADEKASKRGKRTNNPLATAALPQTTEK
jgi:signal transduction histidine kinase